MVRCVALLAALILTLLPGSARAEGAVSEAAQAMVGGWEISNADRDRRCPLTFSVEPAPGGYKVDFDAGCTGAFPVARRRRGLGASGRRTCCGCSTPRAPR